MKTTDYRSKSLLRIFLHYFKPHKKLFALDVACAVTVSAIDLAFPLATRSALYSLLPEKQYQTFFVLMGLLVAAYVLRSFLQFVIAYWGHTFGIRVEADIRRDLFSHLQELSFEYYDKNRTGQLMSRLTSDLFEITELAHHGPEYLITSFLTVVGAMIIMFSVQWKLALVVCLMFPVCLSVVILRRRKMGRVSRMVKQRTAAINADIESSLSGFRTAKAFANEDVELHRFEGSNDRFKISKREFHREMGIFHASMEFFTSILHVVVITVGGYLIMKDQMDYRDIITFSLYIAAFVNPIRKIATLSEMLANGFAGLRRFADVMGTESSIQDSPDAETLTDVRGEITMQDVNFSYKENLPVLHDLNLTIRAGETVAVVGPSGGGKTTLCQLIPRFYDVDSGSICVDGKDIRDVTQSSLRANIGIVQQDVFLFANTVLENIRYGKPDATMEEVVEAAKKAEIYEDIMAMPEGFDTYVGERGMLLSGGQKQRISIARIFLKNPPILILDEATSALDSLTEARIQRAFDLLAVGRTTLIIAHRLSTVHAANRILVISEGEICEQGTWKELLEQDGVFARLYRTQNAEAGQMKNGIDFSAEV